MWILGTASRELTFLYLPGLLSVAVAFVLPDLGDESLLYGLLATGIIDSGHVYTTMWRTWFHREEVKTNAWYLFYPVLFFVIFTAWFYFDVPYLWPFVVYSTLFHHTRQVYGFSKWYQKLNRRTDKITDFFVYFFAFFPMLIYHFRPDAFGGYYTSNDLFLYPLPWLRDALLYVYGAFVLAWGTYEWRLWKSGVQEANRLCSVGIPAVIYAYCFLIGSTLTQVLFPLLFLHGVAYFGVMGQSLSRTQKRFEKEGTALFIVLVTAVIFGLFESWAEENVIVRYPGERPFWEALIVGLSLTPLYCHYAFDAIIWRKNHREASVVFAGASTR